MSDPALNGDFFFLISFSCIENFFFWFLIFAAPKSAQFCVKYIKKKVLTTDTITADSYVKWSKSDENR